VITLQEKIKILGRALVGCHCPELEEELVQLQTELSSLQNYSSQLAIQNGDLKIDTLTLRSKLRNLKQAHLWSVGRYKQRINTLLAANSSQRSLRLAQTQAFKEEIRSLRFHIQDCQNHFTWYDIPPVPNEHTSPWLVDLNSPILSWNPNAQWPSSDNHGSNPNNSGA